MSGHADRLDHVGIVGPDLGALARSFRAIGFQVTPLARHEGGRTGNHCVMLDGSYLELVSTVEGGSSATLARFLARYVGAHIVALGIEDAAAARDRLARADFGDLPVSRTDRALDDTRPNGPRVGFELLTPPDPPEGRVHLIHHLAPGLMWRPDLLLHPNHAASIAELAIVTAEPARSAAWFSRLAGRPVVPDPAAGYRLVLGRTDLRFLPPDADGRTPPCLPWIGRLTLRTTDANAALLDRLRTRGIAHDRREDAVLVEAGGVMLRFVVDAA